jgi:lipopolysaccharide export system protein LptA
MNALHKLATLAATALLLAPLAADARSSDRRQPMDIDGGNADYALGDNGVMVITGGVRISQGTLRIDAARAELTMRGGDPSRAVLTGSPVRLNQQLDNGTPMSAVAQRVDYDLNAETVVFTGGVSITQPRGTLTGGRVVYNMRTGQVNSGGGAEGGGRVKMRILPRGSTGGAP